MKVSKGYTPEDKTEKSIISLLKKKPPVPFLSDHIWKKDTWEKEDLRISGLFTLLLFQFKSLFLRFIVVLVRLCFNRLWYR